MEAHTNKFPAKTAGLLVLKVPQKKLKAYNALIQKKEKLKRTTFPSHMTALSNSLRKA